MITREQADGILYRILNQELAPITTTWHEIFATLGSEKDTLDRGLSALEELIPENTECVLHGWIDQAALEIVAVGQLPDLRDRALNYRADQGGDTGILALDEERVIVLDFSFERGEASLREYKKPNKSWRTNRHKLFNFISPSLQPRRWAHI